jgi:hypothetical protein
MPPIIASTEVHRPAEEVFDYATDPTRFSEWQTGVVEGHLDHQGLGGTDGTRCVTTRRIGFANRRSVSVLEHINRPRTWRIRGIDGPIRALVDVNVEPLTDNRARLTIAIDFEGYGLGKLLIPLVVRRQARREMRRNLSTLKRRLDGLA